MNKRGKKLVIGLLCAAIILIVVLLGGSMYLLNFSLNPEGNKGKDVQASYSYIFKKYPQVEAWMAALQEHNAVRDTFITSADGMRLHALYIKADSTTNKTAVIVHGYTDSSVLMLHIGYLYHHDLGYNILLPDLRNNGESEGSHIQMGWLDRKDVLRWMELANDLFGKHTEMVVHGISMGAATTMMVSGEPQADYVKCFVEDCGYTSVWDQFSKQLKEEFGLSEFPLLYTASWLNKLIHGWTFDEASALKQVAKCHLPMFFIHGEKDGYVPTRMVYELYEAKPEPKELWIVPEATHAESYHIETKTYTEKVRDFTNKYIH